MEAAVHGRTARVAGALVRRGWEHRVGWLCVGPGVRGAGGKPARRVERGVEEPEAVVVREGGRV